MLAKDLVKVMPLRDFDIIRGGRGARILCLDGGGSRGLVIILMLEEIKKQTGKEIIELFDLICGTSTGGLIVLAIVNKVPLNVLRSIYQNDPATIFNANNSIQKSLHFASHSCLYDVAPLRHVIQNIAGNKFLQEIPWPKVFVPSCDVSNPNNILLHLFSSYSPKDEVTVVDAAMATAAAPVYFPPKEIDHKKFVDGGLKANNPTELAIEEANKIWGLKKIDCVVSIGTGEQLDQPTGTGAIVDLLRILVAAINTSSDVHGRIAAKIASTEYTFSYFRLSPPAVGSMPMDCSSKAQLKEIEVKTSQYIQEQGPAFTRIQHCLKIN